MSLNETKSSHPYLTKRIFNIVKKFTDTDFELPKRNIFWIILAPFTNLWLWILIIYIWIFAWVAVGTLKNIENKAKENLWISQNINNEEKEIEPTVDSEKLDLFIDFYKKNKDSWKYDFYIYSNKYDTNDYYTDLFIKKYEDWKFFVKNWARQYIIDKDDKDLWSFEVVKKDDRDWYIDETYSMEELKNIYFK
jgi:hypothetical protein